MNRKSLLRLILIAVAAFFLVKLCTSNLGSVINLPGGSGGSGSSTEDSGGWFSPKNNNESSSSSTGNQSVEEMAREIERELGIGKGSKSGTGTQTQTQTGTVTTTSSSPLTFKGIPISGTSSDFGAKTSQSRIQELRGGVSIRAILQDTAAAR